MGELVENNGWRETSRGFIKEIFFFNGAQALAFVVEVLTSLYKVTEEPPPITIHKNRVQIVVNKDRSDETENHIVIMNKIDEIIDQHGW